MVSSKNLYIFTCSKILKFSKKPRLTLKILKKKSGCLYLAVSGSDMPGLRRIYHTGTFEISVKGRKLLKLNSILSAKNTITFCLNRNDYRNSYKSFQTTIRSILKPNLLEPLHPLKSSLNAIYIKLSRNIYPGYFM